MPLESGQHYLAALFMEKSIHLPEYKMLLDWIRDKRIERGISARRLSEKLDSPHTWVSKVEAGERRLDVIEFLRVCHALRIDPHEAIERLNTTFFK
jgi:transcriptional regulator with XRE-family HTH domain